MYVGQYEPVRIPNSGKLHIQKNGYVYWSNVSKWDNEKKRSIDNRVSIGKVIPNQPGMMYPNKKYFDIFGIDVNDKEKEGKEMNNNMLSDLNIKNFRGIQNLSIYDMRRLVLLSGNNNVGKSSVLEAVFFMMDHLSPDSFNRMNGFRGLSVPTNGVSLWEPLFYQMNPDNTISIQATRGKDTLSLSYAKDDSYVPALNGGIPKNVAGSFQSSAKRDYTLRFDFRIEGSIDYSEIGHYTTSENGTLREIADHDDKQLMQLTYTSFVNNNFVRTDRAILDRMGKAEINGEKAKLIGFLQRIDPSISDIVTLSINGIPQLYINTNKKLLPVQFSGDGINKLLYIVLSIMDAKNGILLVDEIDTGFHYSMYRDLWKIVSDVSRDYNCQVIATTHSYENIVGAVEGVKDYPEDFSFYRLGYDKEGLKSFRFSYDLLKSALRSDMEVR